MTDPVRVELACRLDVVLRGAESEVIAAAKAYLAPTVDGPVWRRFVQAVARLEAVESLAAMEWTDSRVTSGD